MLKELFWARKETGLTQAQVADAVGIDRTAYNRIERGHQKPPVDVALGIAQVLGKRIEEIFLPAAVYPDHNGERSTALEPTGTEGNS